MELGGIPHPATFLIVVPGMMMLAHAAQATLDNAAETTFHECDDFVGNVASKLGNLVETSKQNTKGLSEGPMADATKEFITGVEALFQSTCRRLVDEASSVLKDL